MSIIRIYIFFLILLAACHGGKPVHDQMKFMMESPPHRNIVSVREFGDTLRLEVERRGDTLLKHYFDLKGKREHTFDGSYTAVCTYREVRNDTTIHSTFYIKDRDYRLYFDTKRINLFCDSAIKAYNDTMPRDVKENYQRIKAFIKHPEGLSLEQADDELIINFNFKIVNSKTGDMPRSVLIEYYTTEFSGGKCFYVIGSKGDTTFLFSCMDYIN